MKRAIVMLFGAIFGISAGVLLLPLRCAADTGPATSAASIIVEVNGQPITRADLDEALQMDDNYINLKNNPTRGSEALLRAEETRVLDSLIDEILLNEAARQAKITLTPDEEREVARLFEDRVKHDWGSVDALEQFMKQHNLPLERLKTRHRNGYLVRKLLQQEHGGGFVRPEDIREFYQAHIDEFQIPPSTDLSVILVSVTGSTPEEARASIERAAKMLTDGKPFAEVAKQFPDGPNFDKGGTFHADGRTGIRKDWREAGVAALKVGETSGILDVKRGGSTTAFLIARIDRETEAGHKPFDIVQDEIYEKLEERARAERRDALLKRLREKAFVKRR